MGAPTAAVHRLTSLSETNISGRVAIDIENSNIVPVSASGIPECDETKRQSNMNHESCSISINQPAESTAVEDVRESQHCSQGQPVLSTIAMTSTADGRDMRTENMSMEQTGTSTFVKDDNRVGYRTMIEYRARKLLLSPNIIAVVMGIVISLIPPLQDMLFNNTRAALWPLGAALKVRAVIFHLIHENSSLLLISMVNIVSFTEQGNVGREVIKMPLNLSR